MNRVFLLIMDCVWIIFSGAIGWFALSSSPRFPVLLLTVPILWALASTRFAAFGVWFAFKLTVSRGLIPGAAVFLPETHTPAQAVLLWLLMSLGVSLPFGIFWSEKPRKKAALLVAAFIVAYVLPPVSLIGIVNPLIAVGCILPGWGWRGLFVGIAIFCICASWRKAATAILAIVLVLPLFNLASLKPSPAPHDFLAVNTSFGRLGSGSFKFQDDYDRAKMVFDHLRQIRIHEAREKYIVLPETIAGRLNESGLRLWRDEMSKVLREDQIVFFGAEIPTDDSAKYDNAVVFWGNGKAGVIRQRIPVPYSMYRGPFSDNGASLHFFDNGISELPDGRRIVAVICYEAFLTWPYLVPFLCESKSIICVSNLWWCHDTSLPIIQTTYLKAWGQLFGISVVFACNI